MIVTHLIVGLGNPGEKYKHTRHNVGFMVIDALHNKFGTAAFKQKFHGEWAQASINGKKAILLKPMTFMNHSGKAVQECLHFFKVVKKNAIVIHDELDLEIGRIKVKVGGSNAGHNGLKSIDAHIGNEYTRLRFGIDRPERGRNVADYVLSDFRNAEVEKVTTSTNVILKNIDQLLSSDFSGFMNSCSIESSKGVIDEKSNDK